MRRHRNRRRVPVAGLPDEGYVRLGQVLAVLPISESSWYRGIANGEYPKPTKLGPRTSAWHVDQIREVLASFAHPEGPR